MLTIKGSVWEVGNLMERDLCRRGVVIGERGRQDVVVFGLSEKECISLAPFYAKDVEISIGSPRWTPVTEALPDDEEAVLIAFEDGDVWVGFLDAGAWRTVDAMPAAQRVTHWMRFPEAPKP